MVAPVTIATLLHVVLIPVLWRKAVAIDCYECFSFNNSDPYCGDPFHPYYGKLKSKCKQGMTGRIGEFPARYCIKLKGTAGKDDIEMVFRGCSLESLSSQCGDFKFEEVRYRGCVMSCDVNGCNGTGALNISSSLLGLTALITVILCSLNTWISL